MNIIHVVNTQTLPRYVQTALTQRLSVMPVVVVTGARQAEKSTFIQVLTPGERLRKVLREDGGRAIAIEY